MTVIDARKNKMDLAEVKSLLGKVKAVAAAKGKNIVHFDLGKEMPDDETLRAYLIGPTGNLRAPAAIVGATLYVGFHPDMYAAMLKKRKGS